MYQILQSIQSAFASDGLFIDNKNAILMGYSEVIGRITLTFIAWCQNFKFHESAE
jgi:hypothetical protein